MNVCKCSLRLRVKVKVYNISQSISQASVCIDFHGLSFERTGVGFKPFAGASYEASKWSFPILQLSTSHAILVSHPCNMTNLSALYKLNNSSEVVGLFPG